MKEGLLICTGEYDHKNIGDFIQSLAAQQYYNHTDILVEREELNNFQSVERTKIILNGWFMRHPENWPPSKDLDPLITSLHIVPRVAERMLSPEGISYFKKHEPIGCRDTGTMKILQEKGIDCYFSGCLTLTLGLKYKSSQRNSNIIFVDPYYDIILKGKKSIFKVSQIIKHIKNFFKNKTFIVKLRKQGNFVCEFNTPIARFSKRLHELWCITAFYSTYKTLFSDEVLFNAEYITHNVPQALFENDYDKLEYAETLLKKYSKAHFVVTSRIHCALPCLGLETPVLFVNSSGLNTLRSNGRFGGLLDLFYTLSIKNGKVIPCDFPIKPIPENDKITANFNFKNKSNYIPIKEKLIEQCQKFMQE